MRTGAHRGQKTVSDALELELEALMHQPALVLRAKPLSSERAASPLDAEPSLQSLNSYFRYPSPIMDKRSPTLITRAVYISKQTQGEVTLFKLEKSCCSLHSS